MPQKELHAVSEKIWQGDRKDVRQVRKDDRILAEKIFRIRDSDKHFIDRTECAIREFNAYQMLSEIEQLKPYVPEPIGLVEEDKNPVGLLVTWRDGDILLKQKGSFYLKYDKFNKLKQALLALPEPLWPSSEMFDESNVAYSKTEDRLWFTTCIVGKYDKPKDYINSVNDGFRKLMNTYIY